MVFYTNGSKGGIGAACAGIPVGDLGAGFRGPGLPPVLYQARPAVFFRGISLIAGSYGSPQGDDR